MPTPPTYIKSGKSSVLNNIPIASKNLYFQNQSKKENDPKEKQFFDDNWYFIELHQSILQESSQKK
jgi:hypothetical protein